MKSKAYKKMQIEINGLENELSISKSKQNQTVMLLDKLQRESCQINDKIKHLEIQLKILEPKQTYGKDPDQETHTSDPNTISHVNNYHCLYQHALSDLQKGKVDEAIKEFQEYLELFPSTSLSDNAAYWLAESFYKQRKFKPAIKYFQRVIDEFPNGNKVPAAILKLGFTYFEIGDYNKSLTCLNKVIGKYPQTEEVILAKKMSDKIMAIIKP